MNLGNLKRKAKKKTAEMRLKSVKKYRPIKIPYQMLITNQSGSTSINRSLTHTGYKSTDFIFSPKLLQISEGKYILT